LPTAVPSTRRPRSTLRARRHAAFLAMLGLAVGGTAQAIGLGEITQQSGLGRPLRMVVPIIAAAGEEISGECFKLAPTQRSGDGIPEILTARIALERTASGARLVVTTIRPVDDPVVKVTLQAGCGATVRREYTLLLDPQPIDTPVANETATVPPPAADAAGRPEAAAPATGIAAGAGASPPPTAAPAPRAQDRRRAGPPGPARSTAPAPTPGSAATPAPRPARKATAAPAPQPKLTVSTAIPSAAGPGKGAADAAAREQQELANALEAETIVLRQRVVELTATVDRMQQEIIAAQALQAARLAAEEAAKASPQATIRRWWTDGWPILAMAIGLALLLAAVLLGIRRRRGVPDTPLWMPPVAPDTPPAPQRPAPRPAITASSVARAAAQAPQPRQGPETQGGQATAVAVSELSHVTEEAGVYLAFNRVDRAIEVLEQHIRSASGSLPAAWLMLLDLYRKQGREKDFRALAQEFHLRFNAVIPAWDAMPAHDEADRGLEAFPHIVRQLVSSWGTPECRALLDRLLHDNRDGRRTGFSLPAYEDILFLRQLAEQLSIDADAGAGATARRAPRPAAAAGPVAAATPAATNKLPMALDLELELDRDMLDSARVGRPAGSAPKPGKP